jgi:hypothetical protein
MVNYWCSSKGFTFYIAGAVYNSLNKYFNVKKFTQNIKISLAKIKYL